MKFFILISLIISACAYPDHKRFHDPILLPYADSKMCVETELLNILDTQTHKSSKSKSDNIVLINHAIESCDTIIKDYVHLITSKTGYKDPIDTEKIEALENYIINNIRVDVRANFEEDFYNIPEKLRDMSSYDMARLLHEDEEVEQFIIDFIKKYDKSLEVEQYWKELNKKE